MSIGWSMIMYWVTMMMNVRWAKITNYLHIKWLTIIWVISTIQIMIICIIFTPLNILRSTYWIWIDHICGSVVR